MCLVCLRQTGREWTEFVDLAPSDCRGWPRLRFFVIDQPPLLDGLYVVPIDPKSIVPSEFLDFAWVCLEPIELDRL